MTLETLTQAEQVEKSSEAQELLKAKNIIEDYIEHMTRLVPERKALKELGEKGIENKERLENLEKMSKQAQGYAYALRETGVSKIAIREYKDVLAQAYTKNLNQGVGGNEGFVQTIDLLDELADKTQN